MTSWTNTTRHSSSITTRSKNSSSQSNPNKAIHPWQYNQVGFTYNQVTDTASSYPIYYNSIGQLSWTNRTKS